LDVDKMEGNGASVRTVVPDDEAHPKEVQSKVDRNAYVGLVEQTYAFNVCNASPRYC
jgi:hypothetical protein